MKKFISLLLGLCVVVASIFGVACGKSGNSDDDGDKPTDPDNPPVVIDEWTPENILERKVTRDDLLIGSWVTFADTKMGWSAVDQVERYHYTGINFMPYVSTLPKAGMIAENEKGDVSRDLTSFAWWDKIDSLMEEYNMVYYFTELAGIGGDFESSTRRTSMMLDESVKDARDIIPNLDNCIGVHVVDEPGEGAFAECAKWARRYAAIENKKKQTIDGLVNHFPVVNFEGWASQAQSNPAVDTKVLSHDYYPFGTGGTDFNILGTMNTMRNVANKYNLKLSCFPQSCSYSGHRMPNFEELRWNFNSYLAFGYTQFMYFNYIMYPNEGCADAVFALDGSVMYPELHASLTQFHKELRAMDANVRFNELRASEVYLTGGNLYGCSGLPANWIIQKTSDLNSKNLIFTHYAPRYPDDESKTQTHYLSIVNNSFTKEYTEELEILLGENYMNLDFEMYNAKTGKFEAAPLINGALYLPFEKSEMKILKIIGDLN